MDGREGGHGYRVPGPHRRDQRPRLHLSRAVNSNSFAKGDSNYIGTEVNGGFTWRFAANTAFDLAAYYLVAGHALDMTEQLNGNAVKRDARDGYYAAARVRLSF